MFQMQTKHYSFAKSFATGKAAYIASGRGLQIYRKDLITLFKESAETHFMPSFSIFSLILGYQALAQDLKGGALPLILTNLFLYACLLCPQFFNPTFKGNSIPESFQDLAKFVVWIGRSESQKLLKEFNKMTIKENIGVLDDGTFDGYWIKNDFDRLVPAFPDVPLKKRKALLWTITSFLSFLFWGVFVAGCLLYPHLQFWLFFYLFFWFLSVLIYLFIYLFCFNYENPLRLILIYITIPLIMIVCVVNFYRYGILTKTNITIPALVMIKILGSLRSFILSCVVLYSKVYPFEIKVEEQKKEISKVDDIKDIKVDENLQKFIQITGSKLTIPEKKGQNY